MSAEISNKERCSSKSKRQTAKPGEVYAFYVEMLGKYGVCQILAVEGKSICYVLLDYLDTVLPEADILERLKPYHRESFRYHHQILQTWIDNTPVPRDYKYIGQCRLKSVAAEDPYSWKWPAGEDYYYEERWRTFDENAKAAYKKYINSGDLVSVHSKMFKKNTGGLRDELYQCLTDADTLEDFPCITYAEVQGYSEKLKKLISTAPLLRTLRLKKAGVEVLDLGKTCLDSLELDMSGIRRLILPEDTRSVKLYGEIHPDLQIDDGLCDGKIDLDISLKYSSSMEYFSSMERPSSMENACPYRCGLRKTQIRRLRLTDISELDMKQVARQFPEVEILSISGNPGKVTNIEAVGELSMLRSFHCKDLFGYKAVDIEALESLNELRELDFDSVPQNVGLYLKKHWKWELDRGKLDRLSVTHLRDENWLKDNLENPLRHWDGNEFIPEAAYRSARKCYKDTKKQLLETVDKTGIEEIIHKFTQHFNKLNDRYEEFIETEEREDIFMAMKKLYEECILHGECGKADEKAAPLTLSEVWDVMDEVRENW